MRHYRSLIREFIGNVYTGNVVECADSDAHATATPDRGDVDFGAPSHVWVLTRCAGDSIGISDLSSVSRVDLDDMSSPQKVESAPEFLRGRHGRTPRSGKYSRALTGATSLRSAAVTPGPQVLGTEIHPGIHYGDRPG